MRGVARGENERFGDDVNVGLLCLEQDTCPCLKELGQTLGNQPKVCVTGCDSSLPTAPCQATIILQSSAVTTITLKCHHLTAAGEPGLRHLWSRMLPEGRFEGSSPVPWAPTVTSLPVFMGGGGGLHAQNPTHPPGACSSVPLLFSPQTLCSCLHCAVGSISH